MKDMGKWVVVEDLSSQENNPYMETTTSGRTTNPTNDPLNSSMCSVMSEDIEDMKPSADDIKLSSAEDTKKFFNNILMNLRQPQYSETIN